MEKADKMVEELTIQKKMTQIVKSKLDDRIFLNCMLAIGIMLYLCTINIVYMFVPKDTAILALKIFAIVIILATVVMFEYSYRKDNGRFAIVGIELFIISTIVLYIPYIYENTQKLMCRIVVLAPVFCAVYYIVKSIIIYIKTEKQYQNNLSDVREIVKED